MVPSKGYRFVLKRGMIGHECWGLQINLARAGYPLVQDGNFGPATEAAVKKFQAAKGLTQDGIAGLMTQRSLALALIAPVQTQYRIPAGLLRGQTEGESGFAVGCVNWSSPGGVDVGWTQRRVLENEYNDAKFRWALDGFEQFSLAAKTLRDRKDAFYGQPGATTHKRAWELAVLHHNWPAAAARMAEGKSIYLDAKKDDQPADWIVAIGVPGVQTPRQWTDFYIQRMTTFVSTYTP